MAVYKFRQNNVGGVFKGPKEVRVSADSAEEANDAFFDKMGFDFFDTDFCSCCGRRWTPATEDDREVSS